MTDHVVDALRFERGSLQPSRDALTVELPLQIKLNGKAFSVTMRSPGADHYLVKGLLFTEGIVLDGAGACTFHDELDPRSGTVTAIDVRLPPMYLCDRVYEKRALLASAACGLCGQREFDDAALEHPPLVPSHRLPLARVGAMVTRMRDQQHTFAQTGSTHAAALFDASDALLCVFEDIGRHNAVDKAVGYLLAHHLADRAQALVVSGRISFEIVSKAYRAGIPYLLAVSAPSSFAVDMSTRWGLTLIGYCRDGRCTIYSHPENVEI
ncbi:MAG: formate dehydrogenase accessory sulfurtransferase FdhD [Lentisphaerae bacterium]|nr:formate dehydrogenase accessory sulfurtransferase FdhD [Lentisphaerota bacterium]